MNYLIVDGVQRVEQLSLFLEQEQEESSTPKRKVKVSEIERILSDRPPVDMSLPKFVSYGGGKNSTALLILMKAYGITPDAILFADTGGEKPETYAYLPVMNEWCKSVGFPEITIVKNETGQDTTLEEECLRSNTFPSKTYGRGQCSSKWKIRPQEKFRNKWKKERGIKKHIEYVGYHWGEQRRLINRDSYLKPIEDEKMRVEYPLITRKIDEYGCVQLIEAMGLPRPPKSACFFCPSSKPSEIIDLKEKHPDLYKRAIAIERAGMQTARKVQGLGRRLNWEQLFELTPLELALLEQQKGNRKCSCID